MSPFAKLVWPLLAISIIRNRTATATT